MAETSKIKWGEWVIRRSRVVGFRLQDELSIAIGCRREQLSRWAHLEMPPSSMRKGFDYRLAAALQVSRDMLFNGWAEAAPDAVPVVSNGGSVVDDETVLRRKVNAIAELLGPAGLSQLHDKGRELLTSTAAA